LPLEEVEVTDPTHPLFGRRFAVLSISRQPRDSAVVFVSYRDTMRLRIPISSTGLATCQVHSPRTKWSREAVQELLSLVTEGDPSCRSHATSGKGSRRP